MSRGRGFALSRAAVRSVELEIETCHRHPSGELSAAARHARVVAHGVRRRLGLRAARHEGRRWTSESICAPRRSARVGTGRERRVRENRGVAGSIPALAISYGRAAGRRPAIGRRRLRIATGPVARCSPATAIRLTGSPGRRSPGGLASARRRRIDAEERGRRAWCLQSRGVARMRPGRLALTRVRPRPFAAGAR